MSEIYQWTPANSVEVVAFVDHIRTLTDQIATLTLRGAGAGVTDHAVIAGDASWPSPFRADRHSHSRANRSTRLSDSDDTGLEVAAKALIWSRAQP